MPCNNESCNFDLSFSTRTLWISDAAARICKSIRLPITNVLPQRRCQRQSVYCTYLFFLHVFQTKFKRKKHLPPQVLQQKGIFHSKKFVFYSILFFLHVFQTKFKRKKHLPPQVLQQKGIFHSKKFVFYSILLCFIHII